MLKSNHTLLIALVAASLFGCEQKKTDTATPADAEKPAAAPAEAAPAPEAEAEEPAAEPEAEAPTAEEPAE